MVTVYAGKRSRVVLHGLDKPKDHLYYSNINFGDILIDPGIRAPVYVVYYLLLIEQRSWVQMPQRAWLYFRVLCVKSTDKEMIPSRNATYAHAQGFIVNDEWLIPILKTFAQCTHLLHATANARCFQSVYSGRSMSLPPIALPINVA
jgi:hypothetical protein